MNVNQILNTLQKEAQARSYFICLDIIEQTTNLIKARLHITTAFFVQIYRNDLFDTTNFVLIYNGQRIYGRDQLAGNWHLHTASSPSAHDTSEEGKRHVGLSEFLDEVETVISKMDLP